MARRRLVLESLRRWRDVAGAASKGSPGEYVVGVDIGGTFTDCAVVGPDGSVRVGKVPTRPDDRARSFFEAIEEAAAKFGLELDELLSRADRLVHGTTTGTNALIARRLERGSAHDRRPRRRGLRHEGLRAARRGSRSSGCWTSRSPTSPMQLVGAPPDRGGCRAGRLRGRRRCPARRGCRRRGLERSSRRASTP